MTLFIYDPYDRLRDEGLADLAEKVRSALPSKAKQLLREALDSLTTEQQHFLREGHGTTRFDNKIFAVKNLLHHLERK